MYTVQICFVNMLNSIMSIFIKIKEMYLLLQLNKTVNFRRGK